MGIGNMKHPDQVMIQEEVVDGNGNVTIQNVPAQDSVSYEVDFQ